jgi:hypothetical protein
LAGLELLYDTKLILVEKIKTSIIEQVHYREGQLKINLSDYLSEKLNHNYTYLSNIFSEVKGITIEQFHLSNKIEKVKELLIYDEIILQKLCGNLIKAVYPNCQSSLKNDRTNHISL